MTPTMPQPDELPGSAAGRKQPSPSTHPSLERGATEFVPYVISWNVTQSCNLRCKHCYIDASRAMPGELSTEEALRVLDEIADVSQGPLLILSGGEPLLRPDLDVLVAHAAALGMTVVLGTNGTRLTGERARTLAQYGLSGVGISLDSLVGSRHDRFRGLEGAWNAALEGIQSARRARLDVQIQITLTPHNLAELPRFLRFSHEAGVRVLTVFFLVCTGRGQGLVDLTPEEYERALEWLVRVPAGDVMLRPRCAPIFRRLLAQKKPNSILLQSDAGRCMAGKNYCRITPDGKVTPCPYMPLVAGSLRELSFASIWRSAPLFQTLRNPGLAGRCGQCEYRELCGGCRARALALRGDPLAEDPWCTYVPGTDKPALPRQESAVSWTPEAEARTEKVPFFVRRTVRLAVEAFARGEGFTTVTPELLDRARRKMMKP